MLRTEQRQHVAALPFNEVEIRHPVTGSPRPAVVSDQLRWATGERAREHPSRTILGAWTATPA